MAVVAGENVAVDLGVAVESVESVEDGSRWFQYILVVDLVPTGVDLGNCSRWIFGIKPFKAASVCGIEAKHHIWNSCST